MLDEVTLRNLEILRNIRDRSRRGTLLEFLGQTRTPMGARTLARWIQMPLLSQERIKRRLDAVEELCLDSGLRTSLAEELKGACDLERLVSRVTCKSANPKELAVLKSTLERLPRLQKTLQNAESSYLQDLFGELGPLEEIVSLIDKIDNRRSARPPARRRRDQRRLRPGDRPAPRTSAGRQGLDLAPGRLQRKNEPASNLSRSPTTMSSAITWRSRGRICIWFPRTTSASRLWPMQSASSPRS